MKTIGLCLLGALTIGIAASTLSACDGKQCHEESGCGEGGSGGHDEGSGGHDEGGGGTGGTGGSGGSGGSGGTGGTGGQ